MSLRVNFDENHRYMRAVSVFLLLLLTSVAAFSQSRKYAKHARPGSEKESTKLYCSHLHLTDRYKNVKSWTKETSDIVSAHANFYDSLGKEGILIFAGRTEYEPSDRRLWGIVVIKAESEKEATAIFQQDPVLLKEVMRSEILEFTLPIRYFENLK